jgi:acetyl-CoA carboxylase biotin carboxyl carrier protein
MMDSNELNELRELVEFLKASDIAEFAWSKGDVTLEMKFQGTAPEATSGLDMAQLGRLLATQQQGSIPQLHAVAPAAVPAAPAAPPAEPEVKHHIVKSPIVGTFYESPSPGSPPFVKVGDIVEAGQVLCIVEAMKLMNEIESDAAGEIVERIAQGGQPVEYGQPLFSIKPR